MNIPNNETHIHKQLIHHIMNKSRSLEDYRICNIGLINR